MAQQTKDNQLKNTPWWILAIAVLGLVLVAGSIGFMIYEAVAGDSSPPSVILQVEDTIQTRNGYLVKFRATNEGGSTAEGLTIEGVLRSGANILETSDTVIEYMPAHSEREGGLFFTSDPRQHQLQLRAKGYENP